jgi:hypothetical protein
VKINPGCGLPNNKLVFKGRPFEKKFRTRKPLGWFIGLPFMGPDTSISGLGLLMMRYRCSQPEASMKKNGGYNKW